MTVIDFTKKKLSELTKQQISSRIHLVTDTLAEQQKELDENKRMLLALQEELRLRK